MWIPPTLPPEIITEILSILPVKTLLRFRCVSKPWRSLISSPHFIKLHLNRTTQDVDLSCQRIFLSTYPFQSIDYETRIDDVDDTCMMLDFLAKVPNDDVEIVGSCNGLVCLVVDYENLILCNPSTRDFKVLPKLDTSLDGSFAYGLGYDSSGDDYELVKAAQPTTSDNPSKAYVEVFLLRCNSWKKIEDIQPSITLRDRGFFLNDSLHWLVDRETGPLIVSFELVTEEFQEVSLPNLQLNNFF